MVTVRVHPSFQAPYYGFYLEGLGRVFGHGALVFDEDAGPGQTEFNHGLAVTLRAGTNGFPKVRRIYVSADDWARYDAVALPWCDRFGMVNPGLDAPAGGEFDKIVPIGPSFGIRDWGGVGRTVRDLCRIAVAHRAEPRRGMKLLQNTRKLVLERVPERAYVPGQSRDGYVFYVSWPWRKHQEVNPPRARFMRACRATPGCEFEGGFAPRRRRDVAGIEDVTAKKIYPFRDWLAKTQESSLVFNCPAVHGCLGWKLGEFFALGKAIVSLPLTRKMPRELEPGGHVHFVEDDQEQMGAAVARLIRDRDYRTRLELNARRYYLDLLAPERVISRLAFDVS